MSIFRLVLMVLSNILNRIFRVLTPYSVMRYEIASLLDVRGMKMLDRDRFTVTAIVPTLKMNEHLCGKAMKTLKKYILKMESFKPVRTYSPAVQTAPEAHSYEKLVYMDPSKVAEWTDLAAYDREMLASIGVTQSNFTSHECVFTYQNWRHEDIFKAVLPVDKDFLSSFSKVGHIVQLNLKDHLLDYKHLIGPVLCDKINYCRTVVNKSKPIDNTYRNFSMEVLFGEEDFIATVKENNSSFQFDFSKVYWNSRLTTEHSRIIGLLKQNDILFDVFAGVGPFSIPVAKKNCIVHANDLNPESYKWLNHNAQLNKTTNLKRFYSYNMDGREFIEKIVKENLYKLLLRYNSNEDIAKIHIVMNLPAVAVEFLPTFIGLLADTPKSERKNFLDPVVHVYCFVPGDGHMLLAKQLVESNLQHTFKNDEINVFNVRNVAPNKEMMRVSFVLNETILFNDKGKCNKREAEITEQSTKKLCL